MKRYCVEPRSGVLCQRNQQQPGYPDHHAENSTDDIAVKGGGGGLLGFLIFALLPQEVDRAGFDDGEGRQRKTEQCRGNTPYQVVVRFHELIGGVLPGRLLNDRGNRQPTGCSGRTAEVSRGDGTFSQSLMNLLDWHGPFGVFAAGR